MLEAVREVLQDVYDLPALTELAEQIESRRIRIVETETEQASPFARSLLFGYVAAFMYEGDSPLAERRAAALSLDPTLLAELLGRAELRELLDPAVIEQLELELQRLAPDRRARDAEGVVDLLRMLGPLSEPEILQRLDPASGLVGAALDTALAALARSNRIWRAGSERWAIIEDAARLRDALGTPLPIGIPSAFVEPVDDPLGDLVSRFARTHVPFTVAAVADRLGLGTAVVLTSFVPSRASGGLSKASSARARAAANGVTLRSCVACAAVRSRRSVTRSSPWMLRPSVASSRPGSTWPNRCAGSTVSPR